MTDYAHSLRCHNCPEVDCSTDPDVEIWLLDKMFVPIGGYSDRYLACLASHAARQANVSDRSEKASRA